MMVALENEDKDAHPASSAEKQIPSMGVGTKLR